MSVSSIGPIISPEVKAPLPVPQEKPSTTFSDLLREVLATDAAAQHAAEQYATGASQNLHQTMLALEKADITVSLLVNVRNKLLEAYREVMRMG